MTLPADRPFTEVARSREVLDFLPWALAIAVGCLVAASVLLIPILTHARRAGRDNQSTITARNLLPLGADPTARVNDRVRDAVVQFDLPRDLRPEQMAALLHDGEPELAIAAALLDLQAAGVIDLDEDDRATVRRDADTSGLSDFQQRLLRIIGGRNTRFEWRDWALGALSQDVASRRWHTGRPDYVSYTPRLYASFAGSIAAIMILFSTNLLLGGYWTYAIALYAAALLLLVLAWAFRYSARKRPNRTATGRALAEQLAGFARAVAATGEERHTDNWDAVRVALGVDDRSLRRLVRNIPTEPPTPPR